MVEITELALRGVYEIRPAKFGDERGFFSETYSESALKDAGIDVQFVQDNHSYSAAKGVLRGLHFQRPPHAQDKLVRVVRGSIYDVAVDIQVGSPTFGKFVGLTVSAKEWNQIFVPKGFAHGFVTLEPSTEVIYKVSDGYAPEYECAIRYDDPIIGIEWPAELAPLQLSCKDEKAVLLRDAKTGFVIP